jgi:serine/threonine protein kinase
MAAIICDKCSKEVRAEKRGSLTQWIFDESSCSCQNEALKVPTDRTKSNVCPKCFNFKASRRSGSMTQWIFGRYQCKCSSDSVRQNETDTDKSSIHVSTINRTGVPEAEEDFGGSEMPFSVERYKPLRCIARSPLSVVYKCFDRQLDRLVAIKTLSFPDTETLIRFQEEARATALLKHPNIVEVLDFGIGGGGAAYMVLEFVEAINLDDWLETQGPLSEEETVAMISEVCRALDFAHKKGIYHRDLKPQNILLSRDQQPKLIDFGLVLILSPEICSINDTHGLSLTGTPLYMSPDQFLGRPYDARSEIYSLGCVLFACLTGRPPFQGENALEIAGQHAGVRAPALQDVRPDRHYLQRTQDVVHRCLEKDPELRYPSVPALAEDLQALQQGLDGESNTEKSILASDGFETQSDSPAKSDIQNAKSVMANDFRTLSLALFVLILIGGAMALTLLYGEKKQKSLPTIKERLAVLPAPITVDDGIDDSATAAFDKSMEGNFDRYLTGDRAKFEYERLLKEADKARLDKNATDASLYSAYLNYNEYISLRTRSGPVKAPDDMMSIALIGLYDVAQRLKQFDKLANLEKEIIKYSPGGKLADTAMKSFQEAAYTFVKRKNHAEAARCLASASVLWKKLHGNDDLQNVTLKVNIGTTYLMGGDWNNARIWLERALAHFDRLPPNRELQVPILLELGSAYHGLNDNKTSIQRIQAAEKLALKKNDEIYSQYIGQIYYRWAIALRAQEKFEEAERKLIKGLRVEQSDKSRPIIQSFLDSLRKERAQLHR